MGQAAVDLPDPLSAAPVSSANTDDLLAQLAGEEIERLLADADEAGDKSAPTGPSLTPPTPKPPATTAPTASAPVSSLLEAPTSPASSPAANPDVELNALFAQLQEPAGTPTTPVNDSPPPTAVEPPSAAEALAQEMLEDAATSPGGRSSLSAEAAPAAAFPATQMHQDQTAGTPAYLRLLQWVSRPLDPYPDHIRELIGKIAIVTTVNAAAVMAYVIFIRTH
jgi:hypothetical protein